MELPIEPRNGPDAGMKALRTAETAQAEPAPVNAVTSAPASSSDWKQGLPVLQGEGITLRELRASDAQSLFAELTSEEVSRFISPPPSTPEGFERFIAWTVCEREAGRYLCFAVVPDGYDTAIGLFQIRQLESTFDTAEWGFAIGSAFWGSGLFAQGARLVMDFAFGVIGVGRLEARSAVENGRGNGALRKTGAVQEGILRRSFLRGGKHLDQALWSILHEDWYRSKAVWGAKTN
jgi:ribosomal-protein-alanine N-acetyltransferase